MCNTKGELLQSMIDFEGSAREFNELYKTAFDARSRQKMRDFGVGDLVSFPLKGGSTATGIITGKNRKTFSVKPKDDPTGWHPGWNVHPEMLTRLEG